MKNVKNLSRVLFLAVLAPFLFLQGCDPFFGDGITDPASVAKKGFLYITERESNSIIMLDYNTSELKRWSLNKIAPDTSVQGITFDGKYLWVSFAGGMDKITQIDAESDSLAVVKTLDAPPSKQGTIRGIAFDGQSLWAVNSGSVTYGNPPTLYKMDPATGTILLTVPLSTPDPRGLCYHNPILDVYGRGAARGIYYTDVTRDKIYLYNLEKSQIDSAFTSPKPPMGNYNIYPTGISSDGENFFLINSSDAADHLYRLDYLGRETSRYDFLYQYPQALVWSSHDVRTGGPPQIGSLSPSKGVKGTGLAIDILGSGFKNGTGLTVDFGLKISVDTVKFVSPTHLHTYITIDPTAAVGTRNVTVRNPNGTTGTATNGFEVTAAPVQEYLFWIDQNMYRVYQVRISDSSAIGYWSTKTVSAGSPQGIAFDGNNYWLTCSGTDKSIYKVEFPAGDTGIARVAGSASIPLPQYNSTLRGITFANGFLWQAVSGGKVFRIDRSNGAILDSVVTPSVEPRGILFIGNLLYCVDNSGKTLNEYAFTTSTWRTVFTIPSPAGSQFPTGLSHDGSNFWIANSTTNNDFAIKLNSTGTVLSFIDLKRASSLTYDPSVTGLLYLAK